MTGWRKALAVILAAVCCSGAAFADVEDDYARQSWREGEVVFPAPPSASDLREFYVSAVAENRFFVDLSTLNVGGDGVVRYVLVVLTQGGARNVSFEGMRCETREWRLYASGRADGSWSRARNESWFPVREAAVNRHRAVLFLDYFCPGGVIVRNVGELKRALQRPAATPSNP